MPPEGPGVSPESGRAALAACVVGSGAKAGPTCPICGATLQGRQQAACSNRCRAALSRRTRAARQTEKEQAVRELLERALVKLDGGQ